VEAARRQEGRGGEGTPNDLGPPDQSADQSAGRAATAAGGPAAPEGRRLAIAGHRPTDLGGYEPNPLAESVRDRMADVLAAKRQMHPDLVVLTGLGLGAEQLGAEAAMRAQVPYVAVLPYPDPDEVWPAASRELFRRLVAAAGGTIVLDGRKPASRVQAGAALRRRDAWLARNAHEAVVIWDGEDQAVGRTVRSLRDALGEEEVWVLSPRPDG
jgi:uncharacterized phage-like protein YoqJ